MYTQYHISDLSQELAGLIDLLDRQQNFSKLLIFAQPIKKKPKPNNKLKILRQALIAVKIDLESNE